MSRAPRATRAWLHPGFFPHACHVTFTVNKQLLFVCRCVQSLTGLYRLAPQTEVLSDARNRLLPGMGRLLQLLQPNFLCIEQVSASGQQRCVTLGTSGLSAEPH